MLAGNIPGRTATIPVAIYFAVEAGDMDQALVLVLIVLFIALGLLPRLPTGREERPNQHIFLGQFPKVMIRTIIFCLEA